MTVAAVIACRVGSKRMYRKPLMKIMGKTILQLLVERFRTSKRIDKIVLAISNGEENKIFVEHAKKLGLEYIFGDERDVLGRLIKAADHVKADTIVRATPDCPLIYLENINDLIQNHLDSSADLTFTEKLPLGAFIEVISVDALKKSHEKGDERHRSELVTLFINENKDKFKINVISPPDDLKRPDIVLTVDTPEDLEVMRQLFSVLYHQGKFISVREAVKFLDEHPEIKSINKDQSRPFARIWK